MSHETRRFYRFGNFRLDPAAKVLFCDDKAISLTPKVFDTLLVFVENSGRLLEKDELMQKIWQDRFVEESNLTFNVKMLRRALNDDAREPLFIETVPRRGYRFIAEVKEVFENNHRQFDSGRIDSPTLSQTRNKSYWLIGAFVLLIAGSIGAVLWMAHDRRPAAGSAPILSAMFKSEKFSSDSTTAAITPDGKYVAYSKEIEGRQSVWLRQLASSENIQILPPSDDYYLGLAISNDGNSLYFVRKNQKNLAESAIYRVMTFGGIPVKIAERAEGWISISPDDRQLSFVRCETSESDYCSLFVIGVDGKNERKLLTRPKPFHITDNQFAPDGKSIAFAAGQSWNGGSDFRLLKLDLASMVESEISHKTFFNIESLKWLPGGNELLVAAKETLDGKLRIWKVSAQTGEATPLTNDALNYVNVSLDQAADKLIAIEVSNNFRLSLAPTSDWRNPRIITAARSFAFAPDGKIIYSADDGELWTVDRDGRQQRQLTNSASINFSPQASPDGRYIFFTSNRTGANQIWRMDADGSNQVQITKQEGGYPRFVSPDGNWVYFESGLHQTLWRVAGTGGEEMQVAPQPVFSPAFSWDGRLVAYFTVDKIMVMSIDDAKILNSFALADGKSLPIKIAWAQDNQSFIYVAESGSNHSLWRQTLRDQKPQLLSDLGEDDIEDFALAPDGQEFGLIRGKWSRSAVLIQGLR